MMYISKPTTTPFKKAASPLPDMLAVATAAAAMGRSPRTLRRWVKAKILPAYRVEGRLLISRTDLLAFLERRREARDVEP